MALSIERIIAAVAAEKTETASARTLLTMITAQVRDLQVKLADALATGNPELMAALQAQLDAAAADLEANTSELTAAVIENTPSA